MAKNYEKDSLGSRMKTYESVSKNFLTLGTPKVIRLDMRAGHTFCENFNRPFDDIFSASMIEATKALCEQIPGIVAGYTQSDEISLILNDVTKNDKISCFFDGNIEKIVSLSASICTLTFNKAFYNIVTKLQKDLSFKHLSSPDENERTRLEEMIKRNEKIYESNFMKAQFDSRVFCLPNVSELHNYILWRQQDATRNSIQMVGHANFSQKEMDKKNTSEIQDMLMLQKGINWNDFSPKYKRGCIVLKEQYEKDVTLPNGKTIEGVKRSRWTESEIPILTQDLTFIEKVYNRYILINGKLEESV